MLTQHCLSFLVKRFGDYGCTILQLLSHTKWFFIPIWIIHDNNSSQVLDKRRQGFGQWMNSSIIHANICSLILMKCYPKSYHSDIKYHMKLFVVVTGLGCKLEKNIKWSLSLLTLDCRVKVCFPWLVIFFTNIGLHVLNCVTSPQATTLMVVNHTK